MKFEEGNLYHIYNRVNNKQLIFFKPENYLFFLKKIRKYVLPDCQILAYCLMPNHFHFLIYSTDRTVSTKLIGGKEKNVLSEGIKNLLSSYTQAINKQNNKTGSLFQQNTKAKLISKANDSFHDWVCLHYIHQNPMKAGLVRKMEDWEYSSFRDYCGFRKGTLCNQTLAIELLDINMKAFYKDSYKRMDENKTKDFF